jgi:hypothetical protein
MTTFSEIKTRHAAATPGPHYWDGYGGMVTRNPMHIETGEANVLWVHHLGGVGCRPEDQAFTAGAHGDVGNLMRALTLACARISDSDQTYEEANTSEGWADVFLTSAIPTPACQAESES